MPIQELWPTNGDVALELLGPEGPVVQGWFVLIAAVRTALPILVLVWLAAVGRRYWPDLAAAWRGTTGRAADEHDAEQTDRAPPQEATGDWLRSPTTAYRLAGKLAAGDLCDVHLAESTTAVHVVKITRARAGEGLLLKEFEVLTQLLEASRDDLYGEYFPWPQETFCTAGRWATVFAWRDGFSTAEQIVRRHPHGLDGRHLAWMFHRILEALGHAHARGWLHGAVLPPHLLFHAENHGLQLIDWIGAERIGTPLRLVPQDYRSWYPAECHQRRPATTATDIFLAARSIVWLGGGDPLSGELPPHVPRELRRFIRGCLLDTPRLRPRDAWQLHLELTALLQEVYGPPKFHDLVMT